MRPTRRLGMNAIFVVFVPTQDDQLLTEKAVALPGIETLRRYLDSRGTRTSPLRPSDRDRLTPPLWTWFIENPRNCRA